MTIYKTKMISKVEVIELDFSITMTVVLAIKIIRSVMKIKTEQIK